jgi:hypothetical protein
MLTACKKLKLLEFTAPALQLVRPICAELCTVLHGDAVHIETEVCRDVYYGAAECGEGVIPRHC